MLDDNYRSLVMNKFVNGLWMEENLKYLNFIEKLKRKDFVRVLSIIYDGVSGKIEVVDYN